MDIAEIKQRTHELLRQLAQGGDPREAYHADAVCEFMHPLGRAEGVEAIGAFWRQLRAAFPDLERRDHIFVGGENRSDTRKPGWRAPHLCAALGCYQANFAAEFFEIPPFDGVAQVRYAEAHYLDGDKIRRSWMQVDLADLMRQSGYWPFPSSLGTEGCWPPPATMDGIRLKGEADRRAVPALDTVLAMHDALLSFDGKSLDSMPHARYWRPNFMYYAGAGIGMTRGLEGFRAHHQIPFLKAFPDRYAEGHFIRISDGDYAVTGGNVIGTHRGTYLGMPATGKTIAVPVMDFYRLEGDVIAENWLPIDMAGIAWQMGNDIFARLRHKKGNPARSI